MDIADALQQYELPDGVLPLAPRKPFVAFSRVALSRAAALSSARAEKRGMMTHALDHLAGAARAKTGEMFTTIEAHFDCAGVPPDLANQLIVLGFELDGFAEFVPAHFTDHYTLKYKISRSDILLRRKLRAEVQARCNELAELLARDWPQVEGYIELEVYTEKSRRYWEDAGLRAGWEGYFPLEAGLLDSVQLPRSKADSVATGISLDLCKTSDIHIKIDRSSSPDDRVSLLRRMKSAGFYPVRTWAGNDICTAQFQNMRDAHLIFDLLAEYFAQWGGSSEMTLEPVVKVWRTGKIVGENCILASLPPLIVKELSDLKDCRIATGRQLEGAV